MANLKLNNVTALTESGGTVNLASAVGVIMPRNENLVVKYVNATTCDVDADFLTLFNSSNFAYIASSVNLTADITASGINGLDAGSEATSTWYHVWVIYNGTTVASLLSASATSPTLPSGYTYKKYVGAVYNDSGDDFDNFHQLGNSVGIISADSTNAGSNAYTISTTSYSSYNVLASCPPTAKRCAGFLRGADDSGDDDAKVEIASDANGLGACQLFDNAVGARTIRGYFNVAFITANTVFALEGHGSDNTVFVISQYFYENIV